MTLDYCRVYTYVYATTVKRLKQNKYLQTREMRNHGLVYQISLNCCLRLSLKLMNGFLCTIFTLLKSVNCLLIRNILMIIITVDGNNIFRWVKTF